MQKTRFFQLASLVVSLLTWKKETSKYRRLGKQSFLHTIFPGMGGSLNWNSEGMGGYL